MISTPPALVPSWCAGIETLNRVETLATFPYRTWAGWMHCRCSDTSSLQRESSEMEKLELRTRAASMRYVLKS